MRFARSLILLHEFSVWARQVFLFLPGFTSRSAHFHGSLVNDLLFFSTHTPTLFIYLKDLLGMTSVWTHESSHPFDFPEDKAFLSQTCHDQDPKPGLCPLGPECRVAELMAEINSTACVSILL